MSTKSQPNNAPGAAEWLKRLWPLMALIAATALVIAMGWHRYLSLEALAENRETLRAYIDANMLLSLAAFVALYAAVVALSLGLGITAAYAFGRIAFRGRSLLLMTILAVSMFPQVAVLAGMFELIRAFGLYNTLPGLILANLMLTLPFTVWVLTTFMRELPKEIEEAAFVDGVQAVSAISAVVCLVIAVLVAAVLWRGRFVHPQAG